MISKVPFYIQRIPDTVLLTLATAAMVSATRLFVGNWIWIGAVYVPIFLYIAFLDRFPSFVSRIIAKRNGVVVILVVALIACGVALSVHVFV